MGKEGQPSTFPMAPSDLLGHEISKIENGLINTLAFWTLLWDSRNLPPAGRHWALPGTPEACHGTHKMFMVPFLYFLNVQEGWMAAFHLLLPLLIPTCYRLFRTGPFPAYDLLSWDPGTCKHVSSWLFRYTPQSASIPQICPSLLPFESILISWSRVSSNSHQFLVLHGLLHTT